MMELLSRGTGLDLENPSVGGMGPLLIANKYKKYLRLRYKYNEKFDISISNFCNKIKAGKRLPDDSPQTVYSNYSEKFYSWQEEKGDGIFSKAISGYMNAFNLAKTMDEAIKNGDLEIVAIGFYNMVISNTKRALINGLPVGNVHLPSLITATRFFAEGKAWSSLGSSILTNVLSGINGMVQPIILDSERRNRRSTVTAKTKKISAKRNNQDPTSKTQTVIENQTDTVYTDVLALDDSLTLDFSSVRGNVFMDLLISKLEQWGAGERNGGEFSNFFTSATLGSSNLINFLNSSLPGSGGEGKARSFDDIKIYETHSFNVLSSATEKTSYKTWCHRESADSNWYYVDYTTNNPENNISYTLNYLGENFYFSGGKLVDYSLDTKRGPDSIHLSMTLSRTQNRETAFAQFTEGGRKTYSGRNNTGTAGFNKPTGDEVDRVNSQYMMSIWRR